MISGSLGIKGWPESLDRMVLTSIITGDPLLMISNYGSAKTSIVDRIGQVIVSKLSKIREDETLNVSIINASTANPQDWSGFYVPAKDLSEMRLLKTPQTLIDSVVIAVDEISRAAARNQNNTLSLIQERAVDGIPTKCEILFGMMNPVSGDAADDGSEPLIGAVADRFSIVIDIPEYSAMSGNLKNEIIMHSGRLNRSTSMFLDDKTHKLGAERYVVSEAIARDLWEFFVKTKKLYMEIMTGQSFKDVGEALVSYLNMVTSMLSNDSEADVYVSGRRVGMLYRAIVANHAVGSMLKHENLPEAAEQVILNAFPNRATGKNLPIVKIQNAHSAAVKLLKSHGDAMVSIMAETDRWKRVFMAISREVGPDDMASLFKDLLSSIPAESIDATNFMLIKPLSRLMSKHEVSIMSHSVIEAAMIAGGEDVFVPVLTTTEAIEMESLLKTGDAGRVIPIAMHASQSNAVPLMAAIKESFKVYRKTKEVLK